MADTKIPILVDFYDRSRSHLILLSFYVRQRISYGVWRWLHFGTFVAYMLVTVHGMLVGSDSQTTFMLSVYAFTNASILFLTLYRVLLMKASA